MNEYEVVVKFINGCAGEARPQTSFEEIEAASPEAYLKEKHPVDWSRFTKEEFDEMVRYTLPIKGATYIYEFTEI